MYHRFSILFVALILVGAGCANSTSPAIFEPSGEIGVEVGDTAPDFKMIDFNGNTVNLSDFRGQPVMLDAWASWCPFCVQEIPEIQAFTQEYQDLQVIGIHRTDTESIETGKAFAKQLGATYLMIQDTEAEVHKAFTKGRPLMPIAIFMNADGVITSRLFGPKTIDQMREALKGARQ